MGSAASALPTFHLRSPKHVEKMNSIQDDARSFRSKSAAIKMLIRAEDSRQAFRLYILKTLSKGEVEYLDYFLQVEAMKKSGMSKQQIHTGFLTIIKECKTKAETTKHPVAVCIYETTHSWQGIETLNEADMLKLMNRSQDDILSILTPNFEKFIESKVYIEYSKGHNAREKKRSSGSGLPGSPPVFTQVTPQTPHAQQCPHASPPVFVPVLTHAVSMTRSVPVTATVVSSAVTSVGSIGDLPTAVVSVEPERMGVGVGVERMGMDGRGRMGSTVAICHSQVI